MANRIKLDALRTARRNLEAIAAEHPELLGESSADEWAEALEEVEQMTKTVQVGVRFPPEVVTLIDQFAADATAELRSDYPGVEINRAGAIRTLVEQGLRDRGYEVGTEEQNAKPRKRKPK